MAIVAYIDLSIPGLGVLVVFFSLTFVSVVINIVYLLISKRTRRRCEDAILMAIITAIVGGLMPFLSLIVLVRRGIESRADYSMALTLGAVLLLNTVLAVALAVVTVRNRSRIAE